MEQYLIPNKILWKWGKQFDIVSPQSEQCCCFTKGYGRYVEGTGSILNPENMNILEYYEKYEKLKGDSQNQELFNQNQNQNENERNENDSGIKNPLLDLKLRYFTPREIANLMAFPQDFKFPPQLTTKQKYKVLGNSVNVKMISILLKYLFDDTNNNQEN